jgi:hypothetical protein
MKILLPWRSGTPELAPISLPVDPSCPRPPDPTAWTCRANPIPIRRGSFLGARRFAPAPSVCRPRGRRGKVNDAGGGRIRPASGFLHGIRAVFPVPTSGDWTWNFTSGNRKINNLKTEANIFWVCNVNTVFDCVDTVTNTTLWNRQGWFPRKQVPAWSPGQCHLGRQLKQRHGYGKPSSCCPKFLGFFGSEQSLLQTHTDNRKRVTKGLPDVRGFPLPQGSLSSSGSRQSERFG